MSNQRGPDVYGLLGRLTRRVHYEMKGEHGSPTRAWFARIAVIWIVVACDGSVLWHALLSLPGSAVAFICFVVLVRLLRWLFRRP